MAKGGNTRIFSAWSGMEELRMRCKSGNEMNANNPKSHSKGNTVEEQGE
jgi:hypothetical protein